MAKTIAAGSFIIRKDGKLLVCHPTNHDANFWSIPKGKIEAGELAIDAAIRETFEESNIHLTSDPFSGNFIRHELNPVNYRHKKKIIYPFVFVEEMDSNIDWSLIEIKCNSNVPDERGGFPEMDDYKWVTLEEASKILHETQVACLEKITRLQNTITFK